MRYFHSPKMSWDGTDYPETYDEIDANRTHLRSVIITPAGRMGSNFPFFTNPYSQEKEFTLDEGAYEYELGASKEEFAQMGIKGEAYDDLKEAYDNIMEIPARTFEKEWKKYLGEWKDYWKKAQRQFPVGTKLRGRLSIHRKDHVLVSLGDDYFGIISHEDLAIHSEKAKTKLIFNEEVELEVCGFDHQNMWLELK